MRMKKNILYTLALLSIFAACAKTELPHFGGENDPNAVTINPSVAVLSTKSNPLGDDTAQTQFNEGDVITIKDKSDNVVYKYALGSDGRWKPTDDGKCLLWHSESLNIEASYGDKGTDPAKGVKDQRTAAEIASADYMTYSGTVSRTEGSNELSFSMTRQQALVTVIIASYGDQYNPNTDFITELSIGDINPYIRNKNGEYSPNSRGTIGYKYSAIIPQNLSFSITYKIGQDLRIVNLTSNTNFVAGNSYTINLRVGKDKIEIGDITVSDWGSTDWDDAEAKAYPYVTFSAASEQKFKMDFRTFSLGDEEYFEYSVGDDNWNRFTGTIENVAFGGSKGDLRLRGKSSKGTASGPLNKELSHISFSETDVPVYCTGDIRTLIDYEAYWTTSTANARFCKLFFGNTVLETAPELPATILASVCYYSIFAGCTSLSKVTMLATDVSADDCLKNWLMDAGTSAASRTLTVASDDVYTSMVSKGYVPDLWKKADKVDINGNEIGAEATGLPYVTFSADDEQKFKMNFRGYDGYFILGTGEYFEYSVGGDKWVRFTGAVSDVAFGGSNGDLRLRGKSSKGTATAPGEYSTIGFSTSDVQVKCTGDIRTIINYDNYGTVSTADALFCYLFYNCTALTTAPELNASTLAMYCYYSMFSGCTALTTAPALNASTLAMYCYYSMFSGCTALTTAPALNAESLESRCYANMFSGCTALTTAPALNAESLESRCYANMFSGCTALTTAPALNAESLKSGCYKGMFFGCTALTEVTMLATDVSSDDCLTDWLKNAGTSAASRTLTLANEHAYNSIEGKLPENWQQGATGTTIKYQSN